MAADVAGASGTSVAILARLGHWRRGSVNGLDVVVACRTLSVVCRSKLMALVAEVGTAAMLLVGYGVEMVPSIGKVTGGEGK